MTALNPDSAAALRAIADDATPTAADIEIAVHGWIMDARMAAWGCDPSELTPTLPLVTGAVLDLDDVDRLASWLADRYSVTFGPEDVTIDAFDTLESVGRLVHQKLAARLLRGIAARAEGDGVADA